MSHYTELKVNFTNKEHVIQALIEAMGFTRDQIEVHEKPVLIEDYHGHHTNYRYRDTQDKRFVDGDKCHIIVRRKHLDGASNDMGVYLDKEGGSVLFISDYDRGHARTSDAAIGRLTQKYVTLETKAHYAEQGQEVIEQEHDGKVYLYVKAGN